MKLILVLMLSALFQVSAATYGQNVTLNKKNASLNEVLDEITRQTGYNFIFSSDLNKQSPNISLQVANVDIKVALDKLFKGQELKYTINKRTIVVQKADPPAVPDKAPITIRGKVIDNTGLSLPGVVVKVKGATVGTITANDGSYQIAIPNDEATLVFSFVGYATQEVEVKGKTSLNVQMQVQSKGLDQVVVVGYGQQKKATVTGAVSSIGTTELTQSPQANISNSLVGRLPGLMAVQRSGQPGADQSTLRIRGIGTFSGVQDPLVMVDGIAGVNFNNIDPNEIESLTILKDASSTAVYGVRGANGVVLITTKRGKVGKPQISFTSNLALNSFTDILKNSNAYDYARGYNEALKYDSYISGSYTPKFTSAAIAKYKAGDDPLFYPDVDWFKTMYAKTSTQMQYNLNFSGGVKNVKYFVSAGYFDQPGLFNENITRAIKQYDAQPRYKRYNFRSNFDFNITKGLTATLNLSSQAEERTGNTNDINRTIEIVTKSNPLNTPGIVDGKLITLNFAGAGGQNGPSQLLTSGYTRGYNNNLNGLVRINYDLGFVTKGLSTHGSVSYSSYNSQQGNFSTPVVSYLPKRLPDNSVVFIPQSQDSPFNYSETVNKNRRTYTEFGFDYANSFGNHNVTALLLYNQDKLFDPALQFLVPKGYQGAVGRVTYNFKNRYLAEYDIGYNGTENFAKGKRFGFFPAYSVGWVASKEDFFPENSFISFLKLRGSYGEVGNDQVGGDRFLYLPTSYSYTGSYYYFGTIGKDYNPYTGSVEGKIGNPDLTWERAKKFDAGIELNMLSDKIRITADVFSEKRDNILASLGTVPTIVGANLPAYNLGKMKNSGFDGDIQFTSAVRNFNYWVKANYTYAHNVVEFQDEPTRAYAYEQSTGQRYGQNFGLIAEGLYNTWAEINDPNRPKSSWNNNRIQPGDIRYKDVNSDGIINSDDFVPIGYSNFPEIIFGFSFGFSYKGFDFSSLFQGAAHVSVSYSRHARYGFREDAGVPQYILDKSWTQERYDNGADIEFPHLSEGDTKNTHNYQQSTYWVQDAKYLRLKNAEVGYTLNNRLTKKLGIGSARFYVNGNNLITWSGLLPGIDPESNVASTNYEPYPLVRTINFGLKLKL